MVAWLVRIYKLMRLLLPHVMRLVLALLNMMLKALIAFWQGVSRAAKVIADDYTERAIRAGIPSTYAPRVFRLMLFVAYIELCIGWVLVAHLTVWLFWIVF